MTHAVERRRNVQASNVPSAVARSNAVLVLKKSALPHVGGCPIVLHAHPFADQILGAFDAAVVSART